MFRKPSPLTQMSIAMVMLCSMIIIMTDLFFGVLHVGTDEERLAKQQVGESLSIQVASMLDRSESARVRDVIEEIVASSGMIRSVGVRESDDKLLVAAGDHFRRWHLDPDGEPRDNQMIVALDNGKTRWGQIEILFAERPGRAGLAVLNDPMVLTLLSLVLFGGPAFWLYMRRALQHLDPASVIPERVQTAFDTMSEGIVITDAKGRILLTSRAFREIAPTDSPVRAGVPLSSLSWLAPGLSTDTALHPWFVAMSENKARMGETVVISTPAGIHHLVISCSPIGSKGEAARGCLVSFSDESQLHRSNEALQLANVELSESKLEIERQNSALQRLATRDPLTGCLNRRALFESFEELIITARKDNTPVSCLVVDIDFFKRVNDTYGHGIGDRVIQEVSKKLLELTRSTDLVSRYGGEEFCVVLPGMNASGALALGERIRSRIERYAGRSVREIEGLNVSVSIGVECMDGGDANQILLIDHADKALYGAKRSGRNRVLAYWKYLPEEPASKSSGVSKVESNESS